AEQLQARLLAEGVESRAFDAEMFNESGAFHFQPQQRAVICPIAPEGNLAKVLAAYGSTGLDAVVLDRSVESSDDFGEMLHALLVPSENDAWPVCPSCGKRRLAVCPYCGTAGIDFQKADENYAALRTSEDEPIPLALICSTCDEPWTPEFYRRCEWCNYDFGDGKAERPPRTVKVRIEEEAAEINGRVAIVLVGMAVLLGGVIGWFAYAVGK